MIRWNDGGGEGPNCLALLVWIGLVFLAWCVGAGSVWLIWVLFPFVCSRPRDVQFCPNRPEVVSHLALFCCCWPFCFQSGGLKPGPAGQFEELFTLGTFNPSGLRNKAQYFPLSSVLWGCLDSF